MQSEFSIGGSSGGRYPEAKALPTGTPVRIVSIEVKKSTIPKKNERTGEMEEQHQTCIVLEALAGGTTQPFEKGRAGQRITVPPAPFKAGDRFVHYYGGIYPKREGGWRLAERGGTFQFFSTLKEAGVPITGKFESYVGVEFVIERARGVGANGTYFTPLAGGLVAAGSEPAEAPEAPAPAAAPAKKAIPKKGKPAGAAPEANAFTALSPEDQDAVLEYVKESGGSAFAEAKDLVGHVAKDLAHAQAIIAALPKVA